MVYYIYKIVNIENNDLCYIGHTKCFESRKTVHKSHTKSSPALLYRTIRDNGGWEKWLMSCVEVCPEEIDTKRKAEAREEDWRLKLSANLNNNRCFLTDDQRKEYQCSYSKDYRDRNPEYYRNYSKKYREEHPQYFKEWRNRNPGYHNAWRANKEEFYMCECSRMVNKLRKKLHEATNLHAKGMSAKEESNNP